MAGEENVDPDLYDFKPTKRRRKVPIEPSKRFKPATNDEELNVLTKGYIPNNTKENTAWSLKVFNEWRCSREGNCPADLLTSGNFDDLNYWIPRFVNEARRANGCAYPPIDDCLCQAEGCVCDALSVAIDHEMKEVYGNLSLDIMVRKPPWNLEDVVYMLDKHITFNIGNQQAASE